MGLDASVICNCFRDGKTKPPPCPPEWLTIDSEGYVNLKSEYDSEDLWNPLYAWQQSCCEHDGMNYAETHISNWAGYRLFQDALGTIGWEHFPTLESQLPNNNGGLTPAAESTLAIQELLRFENAEQIGLKTVLVDATTGDLLQEHIPSYSGIFFMSGSNGFDAGLSEDAFFAKDRSSNTELFRAVRFKQFHPDGQPVTGHRAGLVWEDLDSGQMFISNAAVGGREVPSPDGRWQDDNGRCNISYASEMRVEQRGREVQQYDYVVQALRAVFQASVETGNPVRWS